MAFGSDGLALLFTLKAKDEASGVVGRARGDIDREVKGVESTFQRLGQSVGLTNNQITGLTRSLPAVGAGLAVVGGGAVAVATGLFAMAKNASDAGSEIFDLKAKTGLGAESLSALKFAADQSGSSIGELSQAFVIYQNKLTDAAAKGKDLFGIDARRALADQEFALRELTRVLNGPLPAGFSRSSLAAELMGRSGSNLIATFDTLGRDFDKFVIQAKRLGVVLTEEDIKAADEFGDSLTVLQTVMGATSNKMALQFASEMTKGMQQVADLFSRNKDVIVGVFKAIGFVIEQQVTFIRGYVTAFEALKNSLSGQSIASSLGGAIVGGGPGAQAAGAPSSTDGAAEGFNFPNDPEVMAKVKADADRLAREGLRLLDAAIKERLQKEERARRERFAALQAEHDHEFDLQQEKGKRVIALIERQEEEKTITHARAARLRLTVEQNELLAQQRQADTQLQKARDLNLDAETIKLLERRVELLKEQLKTFQALADIQTTNATREDSIEVQAKKIAQLEAMADALERMADATNRMGPVVPQFPQSPVSIDAVDNLGRPVGPGNILSEEQLAGLISPPPEVPSMWEAFSTAAQAAWGIVKGETATGTEMMIGAFRGMKDALGSAIQGWVLYGGSIGKALKQATAAVLAQVAAQAGVKAIFELAQGFAALAGFMPGPAALHFKSAALFGAVAIGAGIAGRGLAGAGSLAGAAVAGAGGGSFGGGGDSFQQQTRDPIDLTRPRAPETVYIVLHPREGAFAGAVEATIHRNVGSNGDLRNLIIETARQG